VGTLVRKFFVELVVVAAIVGWAVTKFPEIMTPWIPWLCLAVFWHLIWEYSRPFWVRLLKNRRGAMLYVMAFVIGGILSAGMIWGAKRGIEKLDIAEKGNEHPLPHSSSSDPTASLPSQSTAAEAPSPQQQNAPKSESPKPAIRSSQKPAKSDHEGSQLPPSDNGAGAKPVEAGTIKDPTVYCPLTTEERIAIYKDVEHSYKESHPELKSDPKIIDGTLPIEAFDWFNSELLKRGVPLIRINTLQEMGYGGSTAVNADGTSHQWIVGSEFDGYDNGVKTSDKAEVTVDSSKFVKHEWRPKYFRIPRD
jgi:hypothetical protein